MLVRRAVLPALLLFLSVSAAVAARPSPARSFAAAWKGYQAAVADGAGLDERIARLDGLLHIYRNKNVDVLLSKARTERAYLYSWRFYLRSTAGGAGEGERRSILERILRKYDGAGVDLAPVTAAYAALTTPVMPAAPATPEAVPSPSTGTVLPAAAPAAEPPLPAPAPQRHAQYLGFDGIGLGRFGLYGGDCIVNYDDRLSFSLGYGMNPSPVALPNATSHAAETVYSLLVRYGKNVYCAAGLQMRTVQGEVAAGTARASGAATDYGVPLVIGVQTGNKRGIFFTMELSYVPYLNSSATTLRAVDPGTGRLVTLPLSSSDSPVSFGLGLGFYLF